MLKALEILTFQLDNELYYSKELIEAIEELEELESRSCENCTFNNQCAMQKDWERICIFNLEGSDTNKYLKPFCCNKWEPKQ